MSIHRKPFGQTKEGREVDLFLLENSVGQRARVMTYGAALVSVETPDRSGQPGDVVLGFDRLDGYLSESNPYFGATCGRYANRIAHGSFAIDGEVYSLAANCGAHALHGGIVGFDKKVWEAAVDGDAVRLSLASPDGEEGYPGNLRVSLTYRLEETGELRLEYRAETDKTTVLNLTNHSYFNLAGGGPVLDHVIRINADRYTVVDDDAIPTGELRDVAGTEMDLRVPTPIGRNIASVQGLGFDHNYCINQPDPGELTLAAIVLEPESGRTLECWTTEPGMQFYTGNFMENITGKGGAVYNRQEGFCLETQHFPDSPNQPAFPSTQLKPGKIYSQATIYKFGLEE